MDIQIGNNAPEEVPNYIGYLYKQFAKDLQGRIVKFLYSSKVYVEPMPDVDMAKITITNKPTGVEWDVTIANVMQKITSDAEGTDQMKDLAKGIVDMYKDHIWHMFFFDFKGRFKKPEEQAD